MKRDPRTSPFAEYWEAYVLSYANPRLRRVHFVATSVGFGLGAVAVLGRRPGLLLAAWLAAAVPPRLARRLWGEPPPPSGDPLLDVLAGLEMWRRSLDGTMDDEVRRVANAERGAADPAARDERESMPAPNMVTDHTLH